MTEKDKPTKAISPELVERRWSARVMAGFRHYVRIRRGDGAPERHPPGGRPIQIHDEPQAMVDAIFSYCEKRGLEPSAREREKLLNL